MSVWIECSVTEGKSPFSISGKHEFKWYSANGSTLKLLRRTYLSYSLHLASRSHFLKSLQICLQSNISFMGNHPCLWKHMRKVSIQLKSSPIIIPMVVWLQWFQWHEFWWNMHPILSAIFIGWMLHFQIHFCILYSRNSTYKIGYRCAVCPCLVW